MWCWETVISADDHLRFLAGLLRGEEPAVLPDTALQQALWEAAGRHGVRSLLHHQLSQARSPLIDTWFGEQLHRHRRNMVAIEMLREHALLQVLDRLTQTGLEPLILKGTALAYTHYPSPELRERCDVDLLFADRAAADACRRVIEPLGFELGVNHIGRYGQAQFALFSRQLSLDVHWRVSNQYAFAVLFPWPQLLARSRSFRIQATDCRTLGNSDALAFALLHRAGHAIEGESERLIWLYDLHRLLNDLDVTERSELFEWGCQHSVAKELQEGINIAIELLGEPGAVTSTERSDLLRDATTDRLSGRGASGEGMDHRRAKRAMQLRNLHAMPGWGARLAWLWDLLLPSPRYMRARYCIPSRWSLPFYYLRRLVKGMARPW